MNASAALQRLDELAMKIADLGNECALRTVDVDWQCARGRRAEKKAEEVAKYTHKLGEKIASVNLHVSSFLAR